MCLISLNQLFPVDLPHRMSVLPLCISPPVLTLAGWFRRNWLMTGAQWPSNYKSPAKNRQRPALAAKPAHRRWPVDKAISAISGQRFTAVGSGRSLETLVYCKSPVVQAVQCSLCTAGHRGFRLCNAHCALQVTVGSGCSMLIVRYMLPWVQDVHFLV